MMVVGIVATVIALFALLVAVAALRRQGPSLIKKTVVVHTKDERTLRGVLYGQYADRWTLRDAVVLGAIDQPLGGLQHVPVENIAFAQEIEVPS
jgi:hypothetical protein